MSFRPRYYSFTDQDAEPQGIFQIDTALERAVIRYRGQQPTLPESLLRLAHSEYERQHPGQDYERMQARGGLSLLEIVRLLADYLERLGGKPTARRSGEPIA